MRAPDIAMASGHGSLLYIVSFLYSLVCGYVQICLQIRTSGKFKLGQKAADQPSGDRNDHMPIRSFAEDRTSVQ